MSEYPTSTSLSRYLTVSFEGEGRKKEKRGPKSSLGDHQKDFDSIVYYTTETIHMHPLV